MVERQKLESGRSFAFFNTVKICVIQPWTPSVSIPGSCPLRLYMKGVSFGLFVGMNHNNFDGIVSSQAPFRCSPIPHVW